MAIRITKVLVTRTNYTWDDVKNTHEDWNELKSKNNWDSVLNRNPVFVNEPITIKVWAEDITWNNIKNDFTDWNEIQTTFTNWRSVLNYH